MAVQIETTGQLQEFLGILNRRKWQVLLPAALLTAVGVMIAVIIPKKYVVTTQVELRPVGISISSKAGKNAPLQIKALARIKKLLNEMQHREFLALDSKDQPEFMNDVKDNIKVTVGDATASSSSASSTGAEFVTIEYSDVDPAWAEDFLRKLRESWIDEIIKRDQRKAQDEKQTFLDERVKLEQQYTREEEQLTILRRDHNLSATQPVPGAQNERGEDPVYERLRSNEDELDKLERQTEEINVRLTSLQRLYDEMPAQLSSEVLIASKSKEAEVNKLELEIIALNNKLKNIKPANSRYATIQQEKRGKEEQLQQLGRATKRAERQSLARDNPELVPLRKEIALLKVDRDVAVAKRATLVANIERDRQRVDELQEVYQQLRVREETIERLRIALQEAENAYQDKLRQSEVLASALASPFELTQDVYRPNKPSEPNPWLIISFAVVAGLILGLGIAIISEFSKNCFRSVGDITRVMAVPVLGAIERIVTRREVRNRRTKHMVVGTSFAVVIGAIVFVTWAWAYNSQLLSQDLRDGIESVRSKFK